MSLEPLRLELRGDTPLEMSGAVSAIDLVSRADGGVNIAFTLTERYALALQDWVAETGIPAGELLGWLLVDFLGQQLRYDYVRAIEAETVLRRLIAARAPTATAPELQVLVDRLARVQEMRTQLAGRIPLEPPAVVEPLRATPWPELPRPPRPSALGGRPRFDEDSSWLRQLCDAVRLKYQKGLTWPQAAVQAGISEYQLNESRRRAGLLDDD